MRAAWRRWEYRKGTVGEFLRIYLGSSVLFNFDSREHADYCMRYLRIFEMRENVRIGRT